MDNKILMIWASMISGQAVIGLFVVGCRSKFICLPAKKELLLWISAGLIISFVILFSGTGGSLQTNAPVTFFHVLSVVFGVAAFTALARFLKTRFKGLDRVLQHDVWPLLALWLLAFFVWSGAEIETNYFIDPPRAPNQIYTPTSDAIYYEIQAQRLLIGEGFEDQAQHSLYTYFLSGLHKIGGEQYQEIMALQIAFLALLPFFIFKLTSRLGSPQAGWLISLLFILREHTALVLGDTITVSNVQVLMTEPLATLGVIAVLYLGVLWLEDPENSRGYPLLIGALIGLVVLIRVELISLAITLGVISIFVYFGKRKGWIRSILVMAVAIGLVITPWVVRNYSKTGTIRLDKSVVLQWAVNRYTHPEDQAGPLPDGDQGPPQNIFQRINYKSLVRIADQTGSSLQQTLLYLPSNHLAFGSLDSFIKIVPEKRKIVFEGGIFSDRYATTYTKSLPYWNVNWDGNISPRTWIPIVFVVLMITVGIAAAWEKQRWTGLLPLLFMVTHIVIYAFFIGSGGRYIQVGDWVTLLYFAIGLNRTLLWIGENLEIKFLASNSIPDLTTQLPVSRNSKKAVWGRTGLAGLCFMVAISMPLIEGAIPRLYTEEKLASQIASQNWANTAFEETEFNTILESTGASNQQVFYGKALYPSYFEIDEYIQDDRAGRVPPPGESRMVFYLTGIKNIWVSLPMSAIPESFPHGAEVVVVGHITRDTPEDLKLKLQPYLLAENVYLFSEVQGLSSVILLECGGENCSP
jgi:NADH:ubiquinone oxidoreductase subunit K